jgi:hypothetical protein
MDVERVVTRRFLAVCEQEAESALPAGWDGPRPETGKLRQSAAVLLLVAERPDRAAMMKLLAETADRVARRQSTREDRQPGQEGGEARLWRDIRTLLDRFGTIRPGTCGHLFDLEVCSQGPWSRRLEAVLRDVGGTPPAATEETLTELARILLRAKARRWSDEDKSREKAGSREAG